VAGVPGVDQRGEDLERGEPVGAVPVGASPAATWSRSAIIGCFYARRAVQARAEGAGFGPLIMRTAWPPVDNVPFLTGRGNAALLSAGATDDGGAISALASPA